MPFAKLLLALIFGMASCGLAEAAEIWGSLVDGCAASLQGEIAPGDADRFMKLFEDLGWTQGGHPHGYSESTGDRLLCLDSTGGSMEEGRKIARLVYDTGVGTRITANARCLSTCGLIFMAGRLDGDEMGGPNRRMDRLASLAFQIPRPNLDANRRLTPTELADQLHASDLFVADMLTYALQSSIFTSTPMIHASLISSMLTAGPAEMVPVDTIEKAARWGVEIDGVKGDWDPTPLELIQACYNYQSWISDQPSSALKPDSPITAEDLKPAGFANGDDEKAFRYLDTGGYAESDCYIAVRKEAWTYLEICDRNGFNGVNHGDCPTYGATVPAYYGLPPNTGIADLPAP